MSVQSETFVTPEEYLAGEADAAHKSEYHEGRIAALPGASPAHSAITTNVAGELRIQFKGRPYRVFANHLRIKVEGTTFYTYPDVVVICDQPLIALEGERPNTVLNPLLIVEVMSEATETADRHVKPDHYRQIPTLREYVIVSESTPEITSYLRAGTTGTWVRTTIRNPGELLYLASIDCHLTIDDVYAPGG